MSAEEDIRKTIARFANSLDDLKDWALMESALAEELEVVQGWKLPRKRFVRPYRRHGMVIVRPSLT